MICRLSFRLSYRYSGGVLSPERGEGVRKGEGVRGEGVLCLELKLSPTCQIKMMDGAV